MADTTEPGRPDDERGADAPALSEPAPGPDAAGAPEPVTPATEPAPGAEAAPDPAAPTEPAVAPVPDEAVLARVAEPARVRRAPKIGAFITAGVLLGALIGFVLAQVAASGSGLAESDPQAFIGFLGGQGGARAVSAFIGAIVGGFAGALAALVADRRSRRR
ncbi:histidine kinase [Cellulomonas sp. Y8]|uniref:histidine kinase n=1 Tax=Cellulomonas sp. Y8 TaxID=2591145 RepID=UPI003D726378